MRAKRHHPGRLLALAVVTMAMHGCALRPGNTEDRAYELSGAWIDGHPAVAWYGGRLSHAAIFLQFADRRGHPKGQPLQLTDARRDAYEPSLQELEGDALVAWYEQDPASGSSTRRQWAMLARFDASGHRLWQRQLSGEDASGRIPVVRVADGIVHVAWLEQRGDAQPMLRVASLDAAGEWLQAPRDAAAAGHDTWNLNAAVGTDGAFHVLLDAQQTSGAKELHWVRVRRDRIDARRVSQDDGRDTAYPDIAFDGRRFAVTWFDARDGNAEVYLRCGELDAGGELPPGVMLDDANAHRVTHTPAESTGAYLVWHQGAVELAWTEGDGTHRVLWRQQFDRDCRPGARARRVEGQGTQAGIPSLAASPQGILLAWNGQRGDPAAPSRGRGSPYSSIVLLRVWPQRPVSPSAAIR